MKWLLGPKSATEPSDAKLYFFAKTQTLLWSRVPASVRELCSTVLFGIGPTIPTNLTHLLRRKPARITVVSAAAGTFVACFVVQAIWSFIEGTWSGSDPGRLYFSQDVPNIINYTLICPAYVALSALLVLVLASSWNRLERLPIVIGKRPTKTPSLSIAAALAFAFTLSTINTIGYIAECLDPAVYLKTPWYITTVGVNGERYMGGLGIYYAIVNFALLFIIVIAVLCFCSLFVMALSIAAAIRSQEASTKLSYDSMKRRLEGFIYAYIIAKLMTVVIIANQYTWQANKPRGSITFIVMAAALTFIGVFFISIPRYLIELEWFRFKVRAAEARGEVTEVGSDDLRPVRVQLVANVLDTLFIGSFITSFWFGGT